MLSFVAIRDRIKRRCLDERGVVVVWVAILLPVILGLLAFTVDVAAWYQQQRQLQTAADAAALAAAHDLPANPNTAASDAQAYMSKNSAGAALVTTTPYKGDSATIKVSVSKPGPTFFSSVVGISPPTITATAVARNSQTTTQGSFFYAGSTSCGAISITHGGDDFTQGSMWSNGGVIASGAQDTAKQVLVGNSACAFPTQLTPPGPTSTSAYSGWPQPLPATPASCTTTNMSVDANWLAANPPGVYCTTGTINVGTSSATFNGYEFVSENSAANAITVTQSGNTFIGYGTPKTIFYATAGGISVNNPTNINGDLFAPNGLVVFNGGTIAETGFIESSTIKLNNGPVTFIGTGPIPSKDSNIFLIG